MPDASSSSARAKPSASYTNAPVITSSLSRMRFGSNRGARDARADEHERARRASAARAPLPSPRRCPSTRARRRTARRRGRAASPASRARRVRRCARRAARTARGGVACGSLTTMSSTPSAFSAATDRKPIGPPPVTSQRVPGRAPPPRVMPCSATASGSAERGVLRATRCVGDAQQLRPRDRPCSRRTRPASRRRRRRRGPRSAHSDGRPRQAVLALAAPRRLARRRPGRRRSSRSRRRRPRRPCPLYSWPSIAPVAAAPLEEEVQVGAADAAVADLEQHVARAELRQRAGPRPRTSRSPMNTAAGIVGGQVRSGRTDVRRPCGEGSPEPDTGVKVGRSRRVRDCGEPRIVGPTARRATVSADVVIRGGTLVDGTGAPAPVGRRRDHRRRRSPRSATGLDGDAGARRRRPRRDARASSTSTPTTTRRSSGTRRSRPSCWHGVTTRRRRQLRLLDRAGAGPSTASCSSARCSTSRTWRPTRCSRACRGTTSRRSRSTSTRSSGAARCSTTRCYVGHTAVRLYVMGEDGYERAATDDEIARACSRSIAEAMAAGADGFATSVVADAQRRRAAGRCRRASPTSTS